MKVSRTMSQKLKIDHLADSIKQSKKSTFFSSIFKSGLLKKFQNLDEGYIALKDGNDILSFGNSKDELKVDVQVNSQEFYVLLGSGGVLGVAEAYTLGYWETSDLVKLLQIIIKNKSILNSLDSGIAKFFKPINRLIHSSRQNTLSGSKDNIFAHYDLSNDFYSLWLDRTMTYSCGIFTNERVSLEQASIEKLDRICRKLKLSSNDKVLEIGTGWGSFALHATKNYGCHVTTTTISDAQYNYARDLFKKEGLDSKILLLKKDYRDLDGEFDKIVSIEMIEAVGHEFIPKFFKTVSSLLKNNGLMALQGITYNDQNFEVYKDSVDFIKKYIFPGSCLISIAQITNIIKQQTDLAIVDMEDITKHYAQTLREWRSNFNAALPEIKGLGFSQSFVNMWEFYFVYCEAGFLERNIGDVQLVFAKSEARDIEISF